MFHFLHQVYRSFAVQLLLLHLRSNLMLLLGWLLLAAMLTGLLGQRLGFQYIFLDPEYIGQGGYWAFVIVGLGYAFLTMSWNVTTYLLVAHQFAFLASLSRPFYKFCINNALLPLSVLGIYVAYLLNFGLGAGPQGQGIMGLTIGILLGLFLYAIYFNLTNRDIDYYYRARPAPNQGPGFKGLNLYRMRDNPLGVTTYLSNRLAVRPVRSVAHYDGAMLRGIFRQNHLNALVMQFAFIILLVLLGIFGDNPVAQIPAGASLLLLFSLLTAVIGAVSYWFPGYRVPILLLLLFGLNLVTSISWFERGNRAYGLSYQAPTPYSTDRLKEVYQSDRLAEDRQQMLSILDNWRAKQPDSLPPFVILSVSGGGLTAGLWATHLAQSLEAYSEGDFLRRTALITGASGGMLGIAKLRADYLEGDPFVARSMLRLRQVSTDMLNPLSFTVISNDIFLPFRRIDYAGQRYYRDRAYAFETRLDELTEGLLDRPLSYYREPEREARIPLMLLTPSVVEDGRRMIISPQGVSFLMAPPAALGGALPLEADMIDFRWLFRDNQPDSLRFLSALRANASYPYVLPQVSLPTQPEIHLMDAGYRDNYGLATATRFVDAFQDWLRENTSGVILVQVSAFRDKKVAPRTTNRGAIESLISPVGVAGTFLSLQILDQENQIAQLSDIMGRDKFQLYRFNFQPPEEARQRASVSLHLTEPERLQILQYIDRPQIRRQIDRLLDAL